MADTTEDRSAEQWRPRDQALDSVLVFAAGLAAAAIVGFVIGILSTADVVPAIGFTTLALGVMSLLSAGFTGGRYAAGGVGAGAARHMFVKESFSAHADDRRLGKSDPLLEELSQGYRAEKDPVAVWLGIGGILYVAAGFAMIVAGS